MREVTIRFDVSGTCKQRVEITQPDLTPELLTQGFREGRYATTVQEGGDVIDLYTDTEPFLVVGKVVESNLDAELLDLEVES